MKKIILSLLIVFFAFNSFSQEKKLYTQKTKGVEAHPVEKQKTIKSKINEIVEFGTKSKTFKTKQILVIRFFSDEKKDNELKKPRLYYITEKENKDGVKKTLKKQYENQFITIKNSGLSNETGRHTYGCIIKKPQKNGKTRYTITTRVTKTGTNSIDEYCTETKTYNRGECVKYFNINK